MKFVLEGGPVYGLAARSVAAGVAALRDEAPHHAVEDRAIVVALQAQLHEVAAGLGSLLGPQLYVYVSYRGL